MDAYEEFNKIKTLEELGNYVERIQLGELKKVYLKIKEEYKVDFKCSSDMNDYLKSNVKSKEILKLDENSELGGKEMYLQVAESVYDGYLDIIRIGNYLVENKELIGKSFFSVFVRVKLNSKNPIDGEGDIEFNNILKADVKEKLVYILAKYIECNKADLIFNIQQLAVNLYINEEIKKMQENIERLSGELEKKIEASNDTIEKITPKLTKAHEDIKNTNDKIKNINDNMITIMALFLTAFSIIGVNIYSLDADFKVNQIILINSSLVFVLSFLMYLLDKIINDGKAHLEKIVIGAGVVLMVVGFIEPIINKFIQ